MVIPGSSLGAEAGQRLVNQPIRDAGIMGELVRQPGIAWRYSVRPLAQQNARGNSSFNP